MRWPPRPPLPPPRRAVSPRRFALAIAVVCAWVCSSQCAAEALLVETQRTNRVFAPGDSFDFVVAADPPGIAPGEAFEFVIELRDVERRRVVWREEPTRAEASDEPTKLPVSVPLPITGGAYRVTLRATRPTGFANRFRVAGSPKELCRREFDVVVLEESAPATGIADWRQVYAFDPASSRWRDRLPDWTGWRRLPWIDAGPFGSRNGRGAPTVRDGYVELAPGGEAGDAHWRAYPLATAGAGEPCLLEIEFPPNAEQQLGVTLFDALAGGRLGPVSDGVVVEAPPWGDAQPRTIRFVCWPKTDGPLLVIHNPSPDRPARFGRIRVSQPERSATTTTDRPTPVLLDFATSPIERFVGLEAAAGEATASETLRLAQRLADRVELAGATGAVVPIAGGDAIETAADDLPTLRRSDLLLRVFGRRGLALTHAVDFDADFAGRTALDPDTRSEMLATLNAAHRLGVGHKSYAGVALRVGPRSPLLFTKGAEGYDTNTVDRFLADRDLRWPADVARDPARHAAAIQASLAREWDAWRRAETDRFHASAAELVGDRLLLLPRNLHRERGLAAATTPRLGREPNATALLTGLGLRPTDTLAAPWAIAPRRPLDRHAFETGAARRVREALGGLSLAASIGSLFERAKLIDAERWFGDRIELRSVPTPYHGAAPTFASALAEDSYLAIVDGGPATVGLLSERAVRLRRTLASRSRGAEKIGETVADEGVRATVSRLGEESLLTVVNTSPWTSRGEIAIDLQQRCVVTPVDAHPGEGDWREPGSGVLAFDLEPFEVSQWRFLASGVAAKVVRAELPSEAREQVAARVEEINRRDRSVRRPIQLIANPSFEDADGAIAGWRVARGSATPRSDAAHDGARSLALATVDDGAAILSEPFRSPSTGQLAVQLAVRSIDLDSAAEVRLVLEQEGGDYRVETAVPAASLTPGDDPDAWRELVFAVDDLPLGDERPLRLRVAIVGAGAILLDDVRTESLKLPLASYAEDLRPQQFALVRLLSNAEAALEQGRVNECRELLDGYWPRFVAEYFPPAPERPFEPAPAEAEASVEVETPDDDPEESTSVADRLKRYLPSFLR